MEKDTQREWERESVCVYLFTQCITISNITLSMPPCLLSLIAVFVYTEHVSKQMLSCYIEHGIRWRSFRTCMRKTHMVMMSKLCSHILVVFSSSMSVSIYNFTRKIIKKGIKYL